MGPYPSLRKARINKGWSIYRLAKESGISRSYIKALENGKLYNPGLETLSKIFKALEIGEACLIYEKLRYRLRLKQIPELFRRRRNPKEKPKPTVN